MNVFLRKLKKTNRIFLSIYFIVAIGYIVSLAFFTRSLLLLTGIETGIRIGAIILFSILGLTFLLAGLVLLFTKQSKKFIFIAIIIGIMIPIFSFGSHFINRIYSTLDNINTDTVIFTSKLIAMENHVINNESILGMIDDEDDIEGNYLARKLINRENLNDNELIEYEDYLEMIQALYDGELDGIFVPKNFIGLFANDIFETLEEDTYVVFYYSEEMERERTPSGRGIDEPFTLLIIGLDGRDSTRVTGNADTLMVLTFNPRTLGATMMSFPRDTYVPIACRNNAFAKINSSAARGADCVKDTIEQLIDIPIDYYVAINFAGLVDLVEALGGITVDVTPPNFNFNQGHDCRGIFCEQDSEERWGPYTIFIEPGIQRLNGEQALAYTRNRHQYISGDFARNRHQQQVVEAIAREARTIRSLSAFQEILSVIERSINTNMDVNKILSFYNIGRRIMDNMRDDSDFIAIERSYLEMHSLPVFLPSIGRFTSAQAFFQDSLDEIVHNMKVNLELEERQLIKTFSYTFGEEYEIRPLGKGLRSGGRLEVMPNFIGHTQAEVNAWANQRGITVNFQQVNVGHHLYNPLYPTGFLIGQSLHRGTLLVNTGSITIYVMNNTTGNPTAPPPRPPSNDSSDLPEEPNVPTAPDPLDPLLPNDD